MQQKFRFLSLKRFLVVVASLLAISCIHAYEWRFQDGKGAVTVKEYSKGKLNGTIHFNPQSNWGREDFRGWFLTLQDGADVQIPHHESLNYKDGFHAQMIFSAELEKTGSGNFQNLFTKGSNFQQGYSIMLHRDGKLLLNLRGLSPEYKIVDTSFESHREYKLDVYVGNGMVRVFVDDAPSASYEYTGTLNFDGNDQPLYIGGSYEFYGNLYYFMIEPYAESQKAYELDSQKAQLENFKSEPLPMPEGTVVVDDFTKFEPNSAITIGAAPGFLPDTWLCRTVAFAPNSTYTLHPPQSMSAPHLTFFPDLHGKYDVYVSVRAVAQETVCQMRLSSMPDFFTVKTLPVGEHHRNMDLCLGRDIQMDGQNIELASNGNMAYISCFKFIPSGKLTNPPPQDPAGRVERGKLLSLQEQQSAVRREIDEKIKNGYFRERVWVEQSPMIQIGEISRKRGYVLFQQSWMELMFSQSRPTADPGSITLQVKAARGEYEPVSFGIHALRPLGEIKLSFSRDFGEGVSASICRVEKVEKRTTNYVDESEFINGPQYLEEDASMSLGAEESGQYWITVKVAEDAVPGEYRGELSLVVDGRTEIIPISLTVYPFALQPIHGYEIGYWTQVSNESDEGIDAIVKEMAEHGMTTIIPHEIFALTENSAGMVEVDFTRSKLVPLAEAQKKYGMTGHLMLPCDELHYQGVEAFQRMVLSVEEYAKAHDWAPIYWTTHDEVPSHPEQFPTFIRDLKALKKLGLPVFTDHLWFKTSRPMEAEVAEASQYSDIFVLRYNTKNYFYVDNWDEIQNECARQGRMLHSYNPNNALTFPQPTAMRFSSGWFFRSFGDKTTGQLVWAYNYPAGDPFTDLDFASGDFVCHYPAINGRKGGYAIDYEAFREGCDDLRYIQTLESLIVEAREKGYGAEAGHAEKVIEELKNSFDKAYFMQKSVFFTPVWDHEWEEKGKLYASGSYNLPNGWKSADYDKAREALAREIQALSSIMGK